MNRADELPTGLSNVQGRRALGALSNADLLVFPDPDDATNRVLAQHQDERADWTYGPIDLGEHARRLRAWSGSLLTTFFSEHLRAPEFLFCFEREGARVLGHYVPGRNDLGLRWEISVNPRHLLTRSERQTAAVLLHELLHWSEEALKPARRSKNGYHSAWFRVRAGAFGIPCSRYGAELGISSPSRFTRWADDRGLRDDIPVRREVLTPEVPLSKRVPWVCACPSEELVTVQVPRAGELRAHCDRCHAPFQRKGEMR